MKCVSNAPVLLFTGENKRFDVVINFLKERSVETAGEIKNPNSILLIQVCK